ncbi:unnamed protein product [Arctogadus glacialis]
MDSFRILLYALIFVLSVAGNLLIIVVLAMNKRMRTVTNCFLLSLALSDLMMALFCMPFTLIPNIMEDFIFGAAMCKIVAYFMEMSLTLNTIVVSVMNISRHDGLRASSGNRPIDARVPVGNHYLNISTAAQGRG